ncbi:major facilitator superfamily domain-containing protein [Auriculariales sp. MPI-PUGE-AT-0066]|nr:major facilitator superfamily domain-containing protein [Auriculariales sp. MPI-PUGE-AT-0066]
MATTTAAAATPEKQASKLNDGGQQGSLEEEGIPKSCKDPGYDPALNVGWKWYLRLFVALVFPVLLECLDYTVVATAQPHIASHFHALNLQSYVGTVYVLTSTVFLPIFASIADVFGRHFALQLALASFLIGSSISTGANSMAAMLAGRGIAGIGAAGILTLVRTILADSRSLKAQTWQAMGMFFLYAVGFSIGPVLGGVLSNINIRWVFGINLPITFSGIILVFLLLRGRLYKQNDWLPRRAFRQQSTADQTFLQKLGRIDFLGSFLFIAFGVPLLLGLNWGSTYAWDAARVIACLTLAGTFLVLFVVWEYTLLKYEAQDWPPWWARSDPMIPLYIFQNHNMWIVSWVLVATGMVMLVSFYFLAIFMTISSGLDPTEAGLQLLYFAPGMGVGSLISMRIIRWTSQPRFSVMLGQVVMSVGIGLISWAMQRNNQTLVKVFLGVLGAGVGMSLGAASIQARYALHIRFVAVVVATCLVMQTFGGTIGIAQCAAVMNSRVRHAVTAILQSGTLSPEELRLLASGADTNSVQSINALPEHLRDAIRAAYNDATRWAFISLIPWTGIGALISPLLSRITVPDAEQLQRMADELNREKRDHDLEEAVNGTTTTAGRVSVKETTTTSPPLPLGTGAVDETVEPKVHAA